MSRPDVSLMRRLIAAAQKNRNDLAALHVINAVSRTVVGTQFDHRVSGGIRIAGIFHCNPVDSDLNTAPGDPVSQRGKPAVENVSRADVQHRRS